ncbi:MAG TPA: LacI family DNA-binding transcriptional regulator [Solirubrobacteraceae bacterium]|nr:LacI family DNA-binding transcriptional regulator [Solirubrobacteraceae bacterium]
MFRKTPITCFSERDRGRPGSSKRAADAAAKLLASAVRAGSSCYTYAIAPRSITSHDVARAAGVSQPTVSRALRGDPRLSEATRKRVVETAEALQYVPSQRGRSLATRSSGQVGIVVSDLGNPFYLQVLDELHHALRETHLRMLVLTPDAQETVPFERLVDGSLDGAILTTTVLDSKLPAALSERGFPFVLLNREIDDAPCDVCVVDNHAGAKLAARELVELGHTRIAALFGPSTTSTGRDREAGFRAGLEAAGVPLPDERWRRAPFDFDAGHRAATELLGGGPTALFCANDILALGAFNALHGRGIRIPEQVSLIGFDDVQLAGWDVFQLTTISQDIPGMVSAATELLLTRMANVGDPLPPRRVVLEPTMVHRRTHGPPPAKA